MTSNVKQFPGTRAVDTSDDLTVAEVMAAVKDANLVRVTVVGETPDGQIAFFSSTADGAVIMLDCKMLERAVLDMVMS